MSAAPAVAMALVCAACGSTGRTTEPDAPAPGSATASFEGRVAVPPELALRLRAGQPVDVVVGLVADPRQPASDASRARVLASLGGVHVVRPYAKLPLVALTLTRFEQLRALAAHADTRALYENGRYQKSLDASVPLIHADVPIAAGRDGRGTAVAVIDTGVDYRKAAFGACASPGAPGCRVLHAADFAPDDGAPDDDGHGTHVAAIVAAVAPGTKLVALDVFGEDGFALATDILAAIDFAIEHRAALGVAAINLSLGGGAFRSACTYDVFAPAIAAARAAGLVVVVASGNDGYSDRIASPACAPGAISVGAVYARGYGAVQYSSCTDVGPKADGVACFSNSAPMLSLVAPGALITAAGMRMAGTSQAAPHVAGAAAILRAAFPNESVADLEARLRRSRTQVTDPRSGLTVPRLDVEHALADCPVELSPATLSMPREGGRATVLLKAGAGCAWRARSDASWVTSGRSAGTGDASLEVVVAPNAGQPRAAALAFGSGALSVVQAGGAPTSVSLWPRDGVAAVRTPSVELSWRGVEPSQMRAVCVSTAPDCNDWRAPSAEPMRVPLPPGDGDKRVYARAQLVDGRILGPVFLDVVLDSTPPQDGEGAVARVGERVILRWFDFGDATSGVERYRLAFGILPPASCQDGELAYEGRDTLFRHDGLDPGTTYFYRLCARDHAGNWSEGFYLWAPLAQTTGEHK